MKIRNTVQFFFIASLLLSFIESKKSFAVIEIQKKPNVEEKAKPDKVEKEQISVKKKKPKITPMQPQGIWVTTFAGLSFINYSETLSPDYSGLALTVKLGYRGERMLSLDVVRPLQIDIGGQVLYNALSFKSKVSSTIVNFLDADSWFSFSYLIRETGLKLSLALGVTYTRMFVTDNRFGYKDVYYPEAFPRLQYLFKNRDVLDFQIKYLPLSGDKDGLSVKLNEFDINLSWAHLLPNLHMLTPSIDFVTRTAHISNATSEIAKIDMNMLTLSVGYEL